MSRVRPLIRSPLIWGVLTFILMFVLASTIANRFWRNSRGDSLAKVLELEVLGILADAEDRRLPVLPHSRTGAGTPRFRLIQDFLKGASIPEMERWLEWFIDAHSNASSWNQGAWQEWRLALQEIRLDIPGASPGETQLQHKLHQARWHVARAQGWLIIGDSDRGLVHFLRALALCREVLRGADSDEHQVEAAFISGKVLFLLFGRTALLREVRSLGSSAIWSVRAGRLLLKERRS